MSLDADQLYALLPAVYRTRDAANGGQLRALFGVLAAQSDLVEQNLRQLYDDQFIETCTPWVIPYLGDLIGYNSVHEIAAVTDSRAEVANTIGYRRRKGTKIALQQVAIDVSGRAAAVVEEFKRLITTESMRHVLPRHPATVDLRHEPTVRLLGRASSNGIADSPFDQANRTIDVRRIAPPAQDSSCAGQAGPDPTPLDIALHGPGRANLPDVAIHLWRWQAFQVSGAPAFVVGGGRYKFSPLGNDIPLFSPLNLPESFTALLTRDNVPQPIARAELSGFYDAGVISLVADGTAVAARQVYPANLADRTGGAWCVVPSGMIAVDPELGRIQFAADVPVPKSLQVSYRYGFPAPVGGGPYDRTQALASVPPASLGFHAIVGIVGPAGYPSLESAVTAWNTTVSGSPQTEGLIVLPGIASLAVNVTGSSAIQLPPGSSLAIVAGQQNTVTSAAIWNNSLTTLTGDVAVAGLAPAGPGTPPPPGQLLISGIWLAGQLQVSGAPCSVQVSDSTLVPGTGLLSDGSPLHPGTPSVVVAATGTSLTLNRVISGPVAADESGSTLICGSVLDATAADAAAYAGSDLATATPGPPSAGPDLTVEGSTIIGKVRARTITLASDSIFCARLAVDDTWTAPVWASRRQAGCVRFCSLPASSITPAQYECIPPDQASEQALMPQFVTVRYGDPAYLLLSGECPMAVWTGADNGSQLGVYLQVQETEAVRNVQIRAPEYLPARLESGIFLHPARKRGP
ncbi:MAG: hypothetical protein ABSB76_02515 [Streptosporangiaceae bacterium]|jgi:hypothetical protein